MSESATPKPNIDRIKERGEFPLNSIIIRNYGRHPDFDVEVYSGELDVAFVAPNGRIYQVRLKGNALRVASRDGGIYVRPKADNVVEVFNVTPFERETEVGLDG